MKLLEADPLPIVCQGCTEIDCSSCEYGAMRWYFSPKDELQIRRKGLIKAMERLQRQIDDIDKQLLTFTDEV
ncbi:MAG: hypothetical protein IJE62_08510 [Clostridia bacterium]|nr:hypothetical protein [Clostridia bacterium]